MEPEAKYTVVGTVVIVLIAAIVLAVVWLRGASGGAHDRKYKIYFVKQSLEGLQDGSAVKLKGIAVGTVTRSTFSQRKPGAVEVLISVDGSAPVRQGVKAIVERHLVTGIASIRLVNVNEANPILTKAPEGERYPLIAEGESRLEQVSQSVTQLAVRVDETLQRISGVLSDRNQKALTQTMENLSRATARAETTLVAAESALGSFRQTSDEVRSLTTSLGRETRRLADRYDALGEQGTAAARQVTEAVRQMSADVGVLSSRVGGLVTSSEAQLRVTAEELRQTSDAVGGAARRLQDPSGALFGPSPKALGPGEVR